MDFKENELWENNHQNISCRVKRYYETWPNGTDFKSTWQSGTSIIKGIIADAEQGQRSVRAYGGAWSLSTVAVTSDYLVDTKQLQAIKVHFDGTNFQAGFDPNSFFIAQCGTSVMAINQVLSDIKRALPTSGASDGQTIVGAFSTGTHGAAVNFGAMQDNVYGLHIITSSNEDIWLEGTEKIISDSYINDLIPGVKRINDDTIFSSAIVSFGNFGIIHGVLCKHVPIYYLGIYQKRVSWDQIKGCLNGPSNFEAIGFKPNPFHFEVIVNPYDMKGVIAIAMYNPADDNAPLLPTSPDSVSMSADLVSVVKKIAGTLPAAIPDAMKLLQSSFNNLYPVLNGQKQYPGNIFTSGVGSDTSGPGLSTELGIDASTTQKVAEIIFDVTKQVSLEGFISFRFVKKSKALLAFTKFDTSCAIEFPSVLSNQTQKFFDAMWARLDQEGILYTFHWGQCNNLNKEKVIAKWGQDNVTNWMKSRASILTTPQQRLMFSNSFLNDCGLNEEPQSA